MLVLVLQTMMSKVVADVKRAREGHKHLGLTSLLLCAYAAQQQFMNTLRQSASVPRVGVSGAVRTLGAATHLVVAHCCPEGRSHKVIWVTALIYEPARQHGQHQPVLTFHGR
jgi:hypothetical protein